MATWRWETVHGVAKYLAPNSKLTHPLCRAEMWMILTASKRLDWGAEGREEGKRGINKVAASAPSHFGIMMCGTAGTDAADKDPLRAKLTTENERR